jgi:hypothetical protein
MQKIIGAIIIFIVSLNSAWAIDTNHKLSLGANYLSGDMKADNGYEFGYSYWIGSDFKLGVGINYLMVDTKSDSGDGKEIEDTFLIDVRAGKYLSNDLFVYVNFGNAIATVDYKKSDGDYETADGNTYGINAQLELKNNLAFTLSYRFYDLEYDTDSSTKEFATSSIGISIGYLF